MREPKSPLYTQLSSNIFITLKDIESYALKHYSYLFLQFLCLIINHNTLMPGVSQYHTCKWDVEVIMDSHHSLLEKVMNGEIGWPIIVVQVVTTYVAFTH